MTEVRVESDPPDPDPRGISPHLIGFADVVRGRRRSFSPHAQYASAGKSTISIPANHPCSGMANTRRGAHALKTAVSSTTPAKTSATIGTSPQDAKTRPHTTSTSVPDAERRRMERKNAVSLRRLQPATPLIAERWDEYLRATSLLSKYNRIPLFIQHGAYAGIPRIPQTFTPANKDSTKTLSHIFVDIIKSEFTKGRYLGPFSRVASARPAPASTLRVPSVCAMR